MSFSQWDDLNHNYMFETRPQPDLSDANAENLRLWETFPEAVANLRLAAGPRYTATIDQAERTLMQMVPQTQQALTISRSAVEPAIWEAAVRASQLAYEVRGRVAKSMEQEMY